MGGITQQRALSFYNVQDYNGAPNTDIAPIVQSIHDNVLPAGGSGIICIPSAGYLWGSQVTISKPNVALISFGQYNTTFLSVVNDPTFALSVTGSHFLLAGLTFQGLNSTSATGGGVKLQGAQASIKQSVCVQFGGKGVSMTNASNIAEMYMEDVHLVQCGMNTTTPDDGLFIDGTVTDCEIMRVIVAGDAAKSTTRNGINVAGNNIKFVACHTYFCKNDGLLTSGSSAQISILGGEYETNGVNGIENGGSNSMQVTGAQIFSNASAGILTNGQANISTCYFTNNVSQDIYNNNGVAVQVQNCRFAGSLVSLYLDQFSQFSKVIGNHISATTPIQLDGQNHTIADNDIVGGNIVETTHANNNNIHDNQLNGNSITLVGAGTRTSNNKGYNPRGHSVTQPAVPASTTAQTNTTGCDCTVFVSGGTVSAIAIGGTTTGLTSGAFRVPVGQTITLTYTVAPSWQWYGD